VFSKFGFQNCVKSVTFLYVTLSSPLNRLPYWEGLPQVSHFFLIYLWVTLARFGRIWNRIEVMVNRIVAPCVDDGRLNAIGGFKHMAVPDSYRCHTNRFMISIMTMEVIYAGIQGLGKDRAMRRSAPCCQGFLPHSKRYESRNDRSNAHLLISTDCNNSVIWAPRFHVEIDARMNAIALTPISAVL
jgi:hypothetical protein